MKRVTKYKNTGQQSRDFSATIRLSKKGGAGLEGAEEKPKPDEPIVPQACFINTTRTATGGRTYSIKQKAAELGMSVAEHLADVCDGNSKTITAIIVESGSHWSSYPNTNPRTDFYAYCLAADEASVYWEPSWYPITPSGGGGDISYYTEPYVTSDGGMLAVSVMSICNDSYECDRARGVLTLQAYADGALVDTLTITISGGASYLCY